MDDAQEFFILPKTFSVQKYQLKHTFINKV